MSFAPGGTPLETAWRVEAEAIVCTLLPWLRCGRLPARGIDCGLVSAVAPRVVKLRADYVSPGYVICDGVFESPQEWASAAAGMMGGQHPVAALFGLGAGMIARKSKMSRNARMPIASFRHCGQARMPAYFGYAAQEGAQGFPSDAVLDVQQGIAHHCAGHAAEPVPYLAAVLRDYLRLLWQDSGCAGIGDMRTPFWTVNEAEFLAVLAGRYHPQAMAEVAAIAQAAGMVEIRQDGLGNTRTGLRPARAIWYLADQRIAGEELIMGANGQYGDTFNVGDNAQVMFHSPGGSQSRSQDQYYAGVAGAQGPGSQGTVQAGWLAADIVQPELVAELAALREHLQKHGRDAYEVAAAGAVAEAEIAAGKRDGAGVRAALAKAGKQALQAAQAIGLQVAATAITKAIGLS